MPYFTHGETKYKLMILYITERTGSLLSADQLYRTAILNSEMDHFAFWNAVGELLEGAVPESERRKLDAYLAENRDSFARETQLSSRIEKHANGATLHLSVTERDRVIFSVSLDTPSEEQAIEMRSRWDEAGESIYNFVWDALLARQK